MKKKDIDKIESLLDKNEFFYDQGSITLDDYQRNTFYLIERMEGMLKKNELDVINSFLADEFSLPKFNLSISILKAVNN